MLSADMNSSDSYFKLSTVYSYQEVLRFSILERYNNNKAPYYFPQVCSSLKLREIGVSLNILAVNCLTGRQ